MIQLIKDAGPAGFASSGNLREEDCCRHIVTEAVQKLGELDIVVLQRCTSWYQRLSFSEQSQPLLGSRRLCTKWRYAEVRVAKRQTRVR
jgi:hypothetical protein